MPSTPLSTAPIRIPLFVLEVAGNEDEREYLKSIGIFSGSLITTTKNTPSHPLVVEVEESPFLLSRNLTDNITVVSALETQETIFEGNKTRQRALILKILSTFEGHFSLSECTKAVQVENPKMGEITIYRTLKTLVEKGIIREIELPTGERRMEVMKGHHDHIVCKNCGNIIEFYSSEMEALQKKIAEEHDISLLSHTMTLVALDCKACREK